MLVGQNEQWKYRIGNQTQKAQAETSALGLLKGDWPVYIVLGQSSVYGLVKGNINLLDDNRHQITITQAGAIIYDKFSFGNERTYSTWLGPWNCEYKEFAHVGRNIDLFDGDFFEFREKYNCGQDFVVTSDVYVFENFAATSFLYEK